MSKFITAVYLFSALVATGFALNCISVGYPAEILVGTICLVNGLFHTFRCIGYLNESIRS